MYHMNFVIFSEITHSLNYGAGKVIFWNTFLRTHEFTVMYLPKSYYISTKRIENSIWHFHFATSLQFLTEIGVKYSCKLVALTFLSLLISVSHFTAKNKQIREKNPCKSQIKTKMSFKTCKSFKDRQEFRRSVTFSTRSSTRSFKSCYSDSSILEETEE